VYSPALSCACPYLIKSIPSLPQHVIEHATEISSSTPETSHTDAEARPNSNRQQLSLSSVVPSATNTAHPLSIVVTHLYAATDSTFGIFASETHSSPHSRTVFRRPPVLSHQLLRRPCTCDRQPLTPPFASSRVDHLHHHYQNHQQPDLLPVFLLSILLPKLPLISTSRHRHCHCLPSIVGTSSHPHQPSHQRTSTPALFTQPPAACCHPLLCTLANTYAPDPHALDLRPAPNFSPAATETLSSYQRRYYIHWRHTPRDRTEDPLMHVRHRYSHT
jgi:hypothetical protein